MKSIVDIFHILGLVGKANLKEQIYAPFTCKCRKDFPLNMNTFKYSVSICRNDQEKFNRH